MKLDLKKFFQSTNPGKTLFAGNFEDDQKYYIDFSSVRGGQIIEELRDNITLWSPDSPTCQLFTGHIGCGKSTELLRLKQELEREGFQVVYFESSQDLEMADVDISDIMLAIARRVSENLETIKSVESSGFRELLTGMAKLLQTPLEVSAEASIPGIGKVVASTDGKFSVEAGVPGVGQVAANSKDGFSLVALGIGKITAKAKDNSQLRDRLRQYLGPRTSQLLAAINQELLEPAIETLKQQGQAGLVVIVDNLDRVDNRQKPWGRPQQDYLFVDQGEYLTQLKCHVVYTMPLALKFSNDYGTLTQRFSQEPKTLPMVPTQLRNGRECEEGMRLMRQMVLARAFPDLYPEQRLGLISQVFDHPETLDRLCRASGGHVRNLLRLLNDWIKKQRQLPLTREVLEDVIRERRNEMTLPISDDEWNLLRQVKHRQKVNGDIGYQTLIRSLFVYEYRDRDGSWFDINPILAEAKEFQSCLT